MKQGDNIAPILFIIVIQFLEDLLEKKWQENNLYMPSSKHDTNAFYKKGHLISHKGNKLFLTIDELVLFLHDDDGATIFSKE